jgi:non-specific serine/threonine protein kinase
MAILTAEIISPELLKNQSGPEVFHQGQQLFRWGRVVVEKVLDDSAQCKVNEGHPFEVTITLTDRYLYLKCECRYAQKGKICEHDVAAALAVQDYLRKSQSNRWQNRLQKILQISQNSSKRGSSHPYLLFFSLQNATNLGLLNWKIAPYHLPISGLPKEIRSQVDVFNSVNLQAITQKYPGVLAQVKSPYHTLIPDSCLNCPPESVILANLIQDRSKNNFYSNTFPIFDYLSLISSNDSPVFYGTTLEPLQKAIQVILNPGQVQLLLEKGSNGLRITASIVENDQVHRLNSGDVQVISYNPFLLLVDHYVLCIEGEDQIELIKNFSETPQIVINSNEVQDFLEKYYLPLAQQAPLSGDAVSWEDIGVIPVNKVYLTENKGELLAQLRFGYGDFEVTYDSRFPEHRIMKKPDTWTLVRIARQPQAEEQAYKKLSSNSYGLKRSPLSPHPGTFTLRSRTHPVDFLLHSIPALAKDGFEVFGEDRLKSTRVNRNKPSLSFHVSSGIDWFDVKVAINFGENEVSLKDLRRSIRKKEKYLKLADGTIGEIPDEWITQYRHLFALGEESDAGIRLSKHHISIIDQLVEQTDQAFIDEEFVIRRNKLKGFIENGFEGIQHQELPKGFTGELRPYQKSGFDWLYFLHDFGFGGCLADDMGLGKTIQALTFFQSLYERGIPQGKASLIIVPRSLLANWQREASRFTPNLRILEYFESSRPKDLRTFDEYDVVVTTYGVMLRDIEGLRTYPFYYVLLDESQLIKNPFAQTAKAARLLNPRHRLVLTGTPVENSTVELWSQFAFLNPGLLGSLDYFKSEFTSQIERQNNDTSAHFLRKLIYPFILRRTKDQVAPELPPRSERILYSDMELAQRKFYNRTRDYYRGMLLGLLESDSSNGARMKVLEGLLRLRQICNHPGLVDEHFRGESGKFELILETLETLKTEGHKALVFSQFVQMLTILRKELDIREIKYEYLDGQTQDRQDRVDTFQNDPSIPFFLISLKAGGLGLNLTAADYVIHIDPWWNPAVEMQATDRTHRIGQDKPVFVYKLITRDSVEEKIVQLQERKKELVDQLITTESSFFKDLSTEDIKVLFS